MGENTHMIRTTSSLRWALLLTCIATLGIPIAAHAETVDAVTISVDLLRHPLPDQARQMLQRAQRTAQSGDHLSAIQQLTEALAKFPRSAAWIQPLLGVEYLKTDQPAAAARALEEAVSLLPHDAVNHSNLGFSLASIGEYDRAEQELRRSLELDQSSASRPDACSKRSKRNITCAVTSKRDA